MSLELPFSLSYRKDFHFAPSVYEVICFHVLLTELGFELEFIWLQSPSSPTLHHKCPGDAVARWVWSSSLMHTALSGRVTGDVDLLKNFMKTVDL